MNEDLFLLEKWTSYFIVSCFVFYILYVLFTSISSRSKRGMKHRGG